MLALIQTVVPAVEIDYTGLPQIVTDAPIDVRGHSVTLKIEGDTVTVDSTTEIRSLGGGGSATVTIPVRRLGVPGAPTFALAATWDKKPIGLVASETQVDTPNQQSDDQVGTVIVGKTGTHALRIHATMSLGFIGKTPRQRYSAYLLQGDRSIGTLNVAFQYGGGGVFGLPAAKPALGWQIGDRGAFVRKTNFKPNNELARISYWTGR